eukprot:5983163-Amphidinium_carterae.2
MHRSKNYSHGQRRFSGTQLCRIQVLPVELSIHAVSYGTADCAFLDPLEWICFDFAYLFECKYNILHGYTTPASGEFPRCPVIFELPKTTVNREPFLERQDG